MIGIGAIRAVPPNFAAVFIEHGWRGIERCFGGRSHEHNAWIAACGGGELRRQRAARQVTGRKCGSGGAAR